MNYHEQLATDAAHIVQDLIPWIKPEIMPQTPNKACEELLWMANENPK